MNDQGHEMHMQSHYLTAKSHTLFSFIAVVFYVINKNTENTPVLQKETIAISEIIQEEKETISLENMATSHDLFQDAHETTKFPAKSTAQNSLPSPPLSPSSTETFTHEITQEKVENNLVEKEQPLTVSAPLEKKVAVTPSISKESLPNIPIKTKNKFEEVNNSEEANNNNDDDDDIFTGVEQTTYSPVLIPNAFTPNSDGLNDIFLVYPSVKIFDYQISIYDRSGQLVYHSKQVEMGWDGTYRGKPAPLGSYVYIITFTTEEKEKVIKQGSVLLIR
jgi:gliding motility-associated-like protein